MPRILLLACCFAMFSPLAAAPPEGSWKLTLPTRQPITVLVAFSQADGKWVGDVIDITAKLQADPKFKDVVVSGESVKFTIALDATNSLTFDGLVAKDGKTLKGSLSLASDSIHTVELSPSKLKNLQDTYELAKEGLSQTEDAEAVYENAREVLKQAAAKKLPAEEARAILDRVGKLAAAHGQRWERHVTLKLADVLSTQDGFADVALAQARKAERMLSDNDDVPTRMATLEALVRTLLAAKRHDDAKPYQAQLLKLEAREYQEFAKANPAFKVEEFKGRKGKSDRVVLVETFSGTEFGASAAIDAARDALLKMYKPGEVIVLTYHLPINGDMDALCVMDNLDRMQMYSEHIRGGQHALVAGKRSVGLRPETRVKDAEVIFNTLRDRINEELEQPSKAKLTLTIAADKDGGFTAKANVADLDKPGEKMTLRFALAEERIRHVGGNGTKYHQMVVRAMPGGANGFPLKTATAEQSVNIKPAEVKTAISKFLAELSKEGDPASFEKVTQLKNLKLVAFIQNDATGDVLTAAMVELK